MCDDQTRAFIFSTLVLYHQIPTRKRDRLFQGIVSIAWILLAPVLLPKTAVSCRRWSWKDRLPVNPISILCHTSQATAFRLLDYQSRLLILGTHPFLLYH